MSAIYDSLPDRVTPDSAWYAKIAVDVADFDDMAYVTIPAFDPNLRFGPCRWQARNHIDLPSRGDQALVIFDDRRQPWIVAWWPF